MSIQSEVSRVAYVGNNSDEYPYPVPFYFFEETDLVVVVTDAAGVDEVLGLNADYVVSGTGNPAGGSVVTLAAIPEASVVTIYRDVAAVQQTSYEEADAFPAKSHERALDRLTMLCQQVVRALRRSYRVRESDGDVNEVPTVPNSILGLGPSKQPRTYTAAELAVWLNLTQQFFGEGTKAWLTEDERALAVPDFLGQVGVQLDDFTLWVANGIAAGDWTDPTSGIPDGAVTTAKIASGALSADVTGRSKMVDGYLTLAKIAAGIFTADAAGREKFAAGFVDSGLCGSGLWNAIAPAGAVLQTVQAVNSTFSTVLGIIPADNTIPQNSEGNEILTASITPSSSSNKILVRAVFFGSTFSVISTTMAIFRDSIANAIAAVRFVGGGYDTSGVIEWLDSPASTSALTYKMRAGPAVSDPLYVNGINTGTQVYNGVGRCTITLQEIKG